MVQPKVLQQEIPVAFPGLDDQPVVLLAPSSEKLLRVFLWLDLMLDVYSSPQLVHEVPRRNALRN